MKNWFRLRGLALLASAISFAGLWLYLSAYMESGQPPALLTTANSSSDLIDFYLIDASGIRYDDQGRISNRYEAPHLRQLHGRDLALVTKPVFTVYRDNGEIWNAHSERGEIRRQGEEVELIEHVVIANSNGENRLTTENLTLFPDRKFAKTDIAVHMEAPGSITDGVGMRADLNRNRIELLHDVRGLHELLR